MRVTASCQCGASLDMDDVPESLSVPINAALQHFISAHPHTTALHEIREGQPIAHPREGVAVDGTVSEFVLK